MCVFLFFKQKTAYEMRISDWSSDVCSSDLLGGAVGCLPSAGGNRRASVETVITQLAVQAGGYDRAKGPRRPGVGQQIAVTIEFAPARPGTLEELQIRRAVDSLDRDRKSVV